MALVDAPLPAADAVEPSPPRRSSRWARIVDLGHRIRSGEDPLAFGAVVAVVVVVAGLVWLWAGSRSGAVPAASAAPPPPGGAAGTAGSGPSSGLGILGERTTTTAARLAVHVAGAVARPGLYHLPAGSRVADAIAQAGGKLPRADLDRLNLAARLVDGQKVHVTRRGEPLPPAVAGSPAASGGGSDQPGAPGEPIDLNTADAATLEALPGIGPATARAIIEERTRRGGFRSTRDLLRVPGIGEGRYARLKDRVRV